MDPISTPVAPSDGSASRAPYTRKQTTLVLFPRRTSPAQVTANQLRPLHKHYQHAAPHQGNASTPDTGRQLGAQLSTGLFVGCFLFSILSYDVRRCKKHFSAQSPGKEPGPSHSSASTQKACGATCAVAAQHTARTASSTEPTC